MMKRVYYSNISKGTFRFFWMKTKQEIVPELDS